MDVDQQPPDRSTRVISAVTDWLGLPVIAAATVLMLVWIAGLLLVPGRLGTRSTSWC